MSEVYFKKVSEIKGPVLALLKKQGFQAVDMHYHSRHSVDGLATVSQVINQCKRDNIGTSFTDHNHISGSLKALKIAKKKVFIVPGIELTCHNGVHVLLHFSDVKEYKEFYQKEMKSRIKKNPWFLDETHEGMIDIAAKYNCLVTTPHPFGPGFCGVQKFGISKATLRKVDAIEVLNGCGIGKMNPRAIKWAKKVRKGFTGGSDGHCLAEHGTSITLCQAETREEFLEEIRKRRSIVIGSQERILEDGINALHKFFREERKAPKKQVEKMWQDRFSLEWNYFKKKMEDHHFFHHFHAHHQEPKFVHKHPHTKHLTKYSKKQKAYK